MRVATVMPCLACLLMSQTALAAFDRLVVFGDSLSDDGGAHGLEAVVQAATESEAVRARATARHTCTQSEAVVRADGEATERLLVNIHLLAATPSSYAA